MLARFSQMFIPTLKESPADARTAWQALLIRGGFARKSEGGALTYLPLGQRVLAKIAELFRRQMQGAGAQEILLPANIDPADAIMSVAATDVRSYKQMPVRLWQGSEYYCLDADEQACAKTVAAAREICEKVLGPCGLSFVLANGGRHPGGGRVQHLSIPCAAGEIFYLHTPDGEYAATLEAAAVDPPATAAPAANQEVGAMELVHTPGVGSIEAVCAFMKALPAEMIKTLIFARGKDELVVALVRGDHELGIHKLAAAAGSTVELADEPAVRSLTSAAVGFAGPVGLHPSPSYGRGLPCVASAKMFSCFARLFFEKFSTDVSLGQSHDP